MNSKILGQVGLPALAFLIITSCEEVETPAAELPNQVVETELESLSGAEQPVQAAREIDWVAARQAKIQAIEAGQNADSAIAQAAGNASLSPVPVMLPSGIVMPANEKQTVAFTPDGYFASYPGAKYDIIVNGTNEVFDTSSPNADADELSQMKFNEMEAGAQISFSRFGADYLVEFECNFLDGDTSCISEEEAKSVVDGLFVAVAE